jgi:hypothetical protein
MVWIGWTESVKNMERRRLIILIILSLPVMFFSFVVMFATFWTLGKILLVEDWIVALPIVTSVPNLVVLYTTIQIARDNKRKQ